MTYTFEEFNFIKCSLRIVCGTFHNFQGNKPLSPAIQYNTIQYNTIQYNTIQYNKNTMQYKNKARCM